MYQQFLRLVFFKENCLWQRVLNGNLVSKLNCHLVTLRFAAVVHLLRACVTPYKCSCCIPMFLFCGASVMPQSYYLLSKRNFIGMVRAEGRNPSLGACKKPHAAQHLTHWGRVTHICISKLTIIGSDNGLSPGQRQAIIWTNAGTLLIRSFGINFSENFNRNLCIFIQENAFENVVSKLTAILSRPQCVNSVHLHGSTLMT